METYHGHVRTPADAIILFEACRLGLLPRVQRRLSEKERQAIKSGSVFVWDEREAGMRRWTDGKSWSASRVSGSFLTYREMEGKRGGGVSSTTRAGKTPDSRGSDDDHNDGGEEGPDGYRYKPDGLMKQSFSITTSTGQHLHLISYYARSHPTAPNLNQPSTDTALRNIRPQKGLYPESTVNDQQNLPVVTRGPMAATGFSLSPHPMSGYPRSGATHPQTYTSLYSWPPTPLSTPPTVTVPYNASYLPPISSSGSPYTQHLALPPPPPQASLPDRSVHSADTALPPPSQTSVTSASSLPSFASRSPRSSQSPLDSRRISSTSYSASVQVSQIDPRLMSPPSQSQQSLPNNEHIRPVPSPPSLKSMPQGRSLVITPNNAGKLVDTGSSGATVPSIGALMNGTSVSPYSATTASSSKTIDTPLQTSLRTRRPSPIGLRCTADGPRDIPNEKIGFGGEDMRALRELDRVFTA
ncbi:Gti1/Pac2 family domain containing protein [Elaphomyces granulatus]